MYMDKGNADEVNYTDFVNDVDRPEDMFGVGRDFNHSYDYFPKMQSKKTETEIVKESPEDLDDILAKIRKMCKEQRIRIQEFFRDFDKLRSGLITIPQFRIGLNMGKIHLSQKEFDIVIESYRSEAKPTHFKWREFNDHIEEVFTTKQLEKSGAAFLPQGARIDTVYGKKDPSSDDRAVVAGLTERF